MKMRDLLSIKGTLTSETEETVFLIAEYYLLLNATCFHSTAGICFFFFACLALHHSVI